MDLINPSFWLFVAVIAGIYGIMSLGLYVQFSLAGLPNFGHVAFMAVAAYAMAILVVRFEAPLIMAAVGGLLAAVVLAFIMGVPALRLRADYLAIATVAGGEIIRYLALNLVDLTGGPIGSIGMLGPGRIAMFNTGWQQFLDWIREAVSTLVGAMPSRDGVMAAIVWASLVLLIAVFYRLERSPWGRVLKGIREDETAVIAAGKNVVAFKMQALVLGAILGGFSGILLAWQIGVFSPADFLPTLTFYAYLILILGGVNRIWAIPLGAALFALLYSGTRFLNFFPLSLFDSGSRAFLRLFLVGLLLVLFMALRPQGLLGDRRQLLFEESELVMLLEVSELRKSFGGVAAVDGASFAVAEGSITALIGPNGAGKTTAFNLISGFLSADSGRTRFGGERIDRRRGDWIARRGLVRVFQTPRVLTKMTVLENMMLAAKDQPGERLFTAFAALGRAAKRERQIRELALAMIDRIKLTHLIDAYAGTLSGGQRKLVELGRALMIEPRMILLDEPMAGVAPVLARQLLDHIQRLRAERGITFLVIEHDMDVVMTISDRVIVMDEGRVIAEGLPGENQRNERVIEAYLGRHDGEPGMP